MRNISIITSFVIISSLAFQGLCEEVCYGDLDCFSDDPPYDGFPDFPPRSPETINTRFLLYTRLNPDLYMSVDRHDRDSLHFSTFNPYKKTYFVVHGFTESGARADWVGETKDLLLQLSNANVFSVDWARGAIDLYGKATQNIRVVSREVSAFMEFLHHETGLEYSRIHLIGHSLGAHVSGNAAGEIPGIARVTGLDPAGPYFRNTDPSVRLDPSDADFVDVIHTDAESLVKFGAGMLQPVGDIDFYPNGGKNQPGCPVTVGDNLKNPAEVGCSHSRCYHYFIESLKSTSESCDFIAYPCDNWADFEAGLCTDCGMRGCPVMGFYAGNSRVTGRFYLQTNSQNPFCVA